MLSPNGKNAANDKIQPDVSTYIKDGDAVTSEKEGLIRSIQKFETQKFETQSHPIQSEDEEHDAVTSEKEGLIRSIQKFETQKLETQSHPIQSEDEETIYGREEKSRAKFKRLAVTCLVGAVVTIVIVLVVAAIVIGGYAGLLLKSLPGTDISDELQPYEKTIDNVTGWDINAIGGYPVLMDGFNPTWINRTVRESGVLSDVTWRFDNTCSNATKEEMKRRGTSMADTTPRAVPCEGNSTKRCVRLPFHFHLHGSYVEKRYAADGSSLTYRGLFNQDMFHNPVSILAKQNPLFVGANKALADITSGKPRVLNFPPAPELPEKTKKLIKLAGTCVDPHRILPPWYGTNGKYKFSKGMKRPFNLLIQTAFSKNSQSAIESALDTTHLDEMLNAMTTRNAAGLGSAQKSWKRRDKGATHVPSASAHAFISCLHFNGDHPEARAHPQRCVNLNGNEVVVAEKVGKIVGQTTWEIKNKQAYEQACAAKNDKDDCVKKDVQAWGHACGYAIVPLEQELLTFIGNAQFDPEGPEGRLLEVTIGRTILKFEDSQLVIFTENTQFFALNEKPSPDGPPAYVGFMEVAPVTWGGPAPSSVDGRGKVPGLATYPYDYTRSKLRMRNMHIMYFNLYKGKSVFFGDCGMPDKEFFWSDTAECHDTAAIKKAFNILRASNTGQKTKEFTDSFASAYAFVETLGCSSDFLRSRRDRSHGVDWLEQGVWLHQLMEYSLDVDLDNVVRRTYWNDAQPVNDKCA